MTGLPLDCDTHTVTVVNQRGRVIYGSRPPHDRDPRTRCPSSVATDDAAELLTLDELTRRVGMSVRNIRFYTTKGLVPPPIRRGRSGYYSPDHVARLELVSELQAHGFTLSAIEKYVAKHPRRRHPRRHRPAPHAARAVDGRAARDDVAPRARPARRAAAVRRRPRHAERPRHRVPDQAGASTRSRSRTCRSASRCSTSACRWTRRSPRRTSSPQHGRQVAEELTELFRTKVWPAYKDGDSTPEQLREVVERLKPVTVQALVTAYESAVNETKRETISRRTR